MSDEKPVCIWEDDIKMDIKDIWCVYCIHLAQIKVRGQVLRKGEIKF